MRITSVNSDFDIKVELVGSKSMSNRALMICHYAGFPHKIQNLSQADDTALLAELLGKIDNTDLAETPYINKVSCKNAGTVLRFLTSALALKPGNWLLTGSERMLQRPVKPLVDSLRQLGADIDYQGVSGFPPLLIKGGDIEGSEVSVDISRSSQYASSLLLAAPNFKNGMSLHLKGEMTSLPYIDMTIEIMRKYGAKVYRENRDVFVERSDYQNVNYVVEGDWSSASYWYEAVALSRNGRVFLENLKLDSIQGDKILSQMFEQLGVVTKETGNGLLIEKTNSLNVNELKFDFVDNPDLFPAVVASCAGLQVKAAFSGLRNLTIKESDRIATMTCELRKIGVELGKISDDILEINDIRNVLTFSGDNPVVFDSHGDHRIAMSLAPLSLKIGAVEIADAAAVSKSYPSFWSDFSKLF